VRYVRAGQGDRVLLLHGFASSIYSWKDVIADLSRDHEVVGLDMPPFGASAVPPSPSAEMYRRLVVAALDHLQWPHATVIGNSLGGAVAVVAAAQHPARVDHLVLVDSAGYNFAPADRPALLRVAGAPFLGPVLGHLPVRREVVTLGLKQVFYDDAKVTPERIDEYVAPLLRPGALAASQALLRGGMDLGFPGVIAGVKAPTLVIWGEDDTWIPPAHAQLFARDIPGARVAMIPQCGHVPQEERPDEVVRNIRLFLGPR
jgi:pimeloyl-ACP methyl ester carboxylesterase